MSIQWISGRTHRYISIGSASLGIIILGVCLLAGGETRVEGVIFTLGYLGLPATIAGSGLVAMLPDSWDSQGFATPIVCTIFFIAQWQFVAWLVYKWSTRKRSPANL
jgi:hypothetical protein